MPPEPELAHPSFSRRASNTSAASSSSRTSSAEKAHAKSLRNAGKEAFLTVVRETVQELGLEAANEAIEEEAIRMEEMQTRRSGSSRSFHHKRTASRGSNHDLITPTSHGRPGLGASQDSACGSPFRSSTSSRTVGSGRRSSTGGHHGVGVDAAEPSERRRRRHRKSSMGQGEGQSIVAAAMANFGDGVGANPGAIPEEGRDLSRSLHGSYSADPGDGAAAAEAAVGRPAAVAAEGGGEATSFRNTAETMEDDERETLLALLTGAYGQVNDLTDELKISLDKLNDTEKELKAVNAAHAKLQAMRNPSPTPLNGQSGAHAEGGTPKRSPVSKLLKDVLPNDEGGKSTPAAVRQLQVEVQRLRQRNAQAHSKEEKYKSEIAHLKRLMAVMESQVAKADQDLGSADASRGRSARQMSTAGGAHSQDGATKPLVARVAELEEKLVVCSMENATAKQEHLTSQLASQKLDKTLQKLRHELAKSRAMNDLLQNEIDRLQGRDPEGEADGSGWRRWLGGVQEPLSPEPNPIQVTGGSDSPVVVVRDLDNNQLVYAPGRSQFG
ncbi:unnamed protein product [Ectocarpus sp. CCAP 1310/34]|nr:unnamed protein product [Ectocarpus sp. CCAP 1310/34]